jgi:hypothetical protein
MPFHLLIPTLLLALISSCSAQTEANEVSIANAEQLTDTPQPDSILSRQEILANLKNKVENHEPLVIHVLVPLCDNANQGIVPVPERLGNGRDLLSNLYWGALYGVKTHFLRTAKWTVLLDEKYTTGAVLERVVFYKKFENGAKVYMIADGYGGDNMSECLHDYFLSLAGYDSTSIKLKDTTIKAYGQSNLIVFNGHNGLLEVFPDTSIRQTAGNREAMAIACGTNYNFPGYIAYTGAYPLLTTNNLLAPEAYVLEAAINNWAALKDEEEISTAASKAYLKYQDCGKKYADDLFHAGW